MFSGVERIRNTAFCFLLSAFCLFAFTSCDKEEKLYNYWNLQSVLMNGEPLNDSLQFNLIPYFTYYTFSYASSLEVSTFALGKFMSSSDGFYYFDSKSTIKMRFTLLYTRYDITAKIKKLTRKELNLEYEDNGNTYFLKLYTN
jgi:hypothetical protein